jgi:asparagine synthase (glutamine-hydrolysing)
MPGITGIFSLSPLENGVNRLSQMLRPMMHDDSYTSGEYVNQEVGIFSALIARDSATRPNLSWNNSHDIGCFISGETAVDKTDADPTQTKRRYTSGEEASILAHLYEESGTKALLKLNGWFSGLIVDLRKREMVLFNDRFGLNRIYVHESGRDLLFSSEAKSLLAVVPELRELDPCGLAEWFSCGCVLGNRTLFRGISLLPAGSAWKFSRGSLTKATYFNASTWESQPLLSPFEFSEQLQQTFPRILSRYTNGSRPIAMSLTGGLDGRMIMAWNRANRGSLPCYTFNGPYRDCADARIARKVADACGQPHQIISVKEEFLKQFPQLAEQSVTITDGAMDVTGAVEIYVNRIARKIAPVRLTGNYGSEILRRYIAFRPRSLPAEMFSQDFLPHFSIAEKSYAAEAIGNPLSFIAFKQVPWHHYSRFAIEKSQIALRSPYLDNDLVALAFRMPAEFAISLEPSLSLIAQGNPILGQIPTDRGITYPAYNLANRVNRLMAELLSKAEYAYDYGMPNWLARMDRYIGPLRLERLFLGHQKFCHFRTWYRHELSDYVKQILLDPRSRARNHVNGLALEKMVHAHIEGNRNHTTEIHKFLSIELLHRNLLDRVPGKY